MLGSFGYVKLLLAGNPSRWEICILILGLLSAIASGIPFPLLGIIFGQLVDDLNGTSCTQDINVSSYQQNVNSKILVIVYLAIAQFFLMYAHLTCWSIYGARLAQRLRYQYLHTLLQQPASFFDTRSTGEISSRINSDIQTIRSGTSEKVGIVISSTSFFVTAYVVAFIKNTKLAAILLSLVPAYFLMSLIGNRYIERFAGLASDHVAKGASVALESLSNIPFIHSFNANTRLESRFSQTLNDARRDGIKKSLAIGVQAGLMYFVAYSANALAFWQGSVAIAKAVEENAGSTTVGKTYTVIFILVDGECQIHNVCGHVYRWPAIEVTY
jgi:ATP-binding cassette subfamily B (MDR/TAP) protein 1